MNDQAQAKAIVKAINRRCRKRLCPRDYTAWARDYPQMAAEFDKAAATLSGHPGRYRPKFQ